ncbi:MAG TPA: hypothetical protein VLG37_04190 [Candidatus Saccharimonadales bacterium]|nr:hypothetical protein [Candidatus Saccharimonadales bacterium]
MFEALKSRKGRRYVALFGGLVIVAGSGTAYYRSHNQDKKCSQFTQTLKSPSINPIIPVEGSKVDIKRAYVLEYNAGRLLIRQTVHLPQAAGHPYVNLAAQSLAEQALTLGVQPQFAGFSESDPDRTVSFMIHGTSNPTGPATVDAKICEG